MEKTKILIIDDHPAMRYGLSHLVDREPDLEVCGEAGDRETALAATRNNPPDLIILDISLAMSPATGWTCSPKSTRSLDPFRPWSSPCMTKPFTPNAPSRPGPRAT